MVVTFKDIDKVHNRPSSTARKAFTRHKKKLIEGEDYFVVTRNNQMSLSCTFENIPTRGITCLTESGYLMVVKVFDDDLAWEVQRKLVNSYFTLKQNIQHSSSTDEILSVMQTIMNPIVSGIAIMNQNFSNMQRERYLPVKEHSNWISDTFKKINAFKLKILEETNDDMGISSIIHMLIKETEDTYNFDLNDYIAKFKLEYGIGDPLALQVIDHYYDVRGMFDLVIDGHMDRLGLASNALRKENILDRIERNIQHKEESTN